MNSLLVAKVLLTIVTLAYSLGMVLADFNKTHATNPRWTPHARFHLVWQVLSLNALGLFSLLLIWWPEPYAVERLQIVCLFALMVYVPFFLALFAMRRYGGSSHDKNGYPPVKVRLLGHTLSLDMNVTTFVVYAVLLAVAFILIQTTPDT